MLTRRGHRSQEPVNMPVTTRSIALPGSALIPPSLFWSGVRD
jgi:hypothetical protein